MCFSSTYVPCTRPLIALPAHVRAFFEPARMDLIRDDFIKHLPRVRNSISAGVGESVFSTDERGIPK